MDEESIYNLIPREYVPPPKPPMYHSKFPSNVPPTASTFINHTTSRPGVANVGGNFNLGIEAHTHKGPTKTFGYSKGAIKPSTAGFTRKGTGTMGSNSLPPAQRFGYDDTFKKPAIPAKDEKPIHGLSSNKNFIVSNAVENILAAPKALKEEKKYVEKKEYGQIPGYLTRIKDQINTEYRSIREMQAAEEEAREKEKFLLTAEEVTALKAGLQKKWDAVNKEYQTITHVSKVDTQGLKRKKEECERQLAQIEKDMAKLNKQYIFVDTMNHAY